MPRCRNRRNCFYHTRGYCRFSHSPSPPAQRCRSRSRSRDRGNSNKSPPRVHLTVKSENDNKEEELKSSSYPLQFMTHGESKKWGDIKMKQTENGLEMTGISLHPTRIGRCSLMTGKYYYEVHLKSTPCDVRIGWGLHSQNIDDINNKRTGSDKKGWTYSGVTGTGVSGVKGKRYWNDVLVLMYGLKWKGDGDVVSCAIDIDGKELRFYLNGQDLGIAFSTVDVLGEGIAPSISVEKDAKIVVVTEKANFKYNMPSGFSEINVEFKMTLSRIMNRVNVEMGHDLGKMLKEAVYKDINAKDVEEILNNLQLDEEKKLKLKLFVQQEYEYVPVINREINRNEIKILLRNRGFKLHHIDVVLKEDYDGCNVDEQMLNNLVSKCVEYESKDAYQIHLKNWKKWDCNEVIEWINTLSDGCFVDDKYSTFKQYLKIQKVNGIYLETMDDLTLKLLTLNDINDRNLIINSINKLTQRKRMQNEIEPPSEYLDKISYELMSDPVICIKSGYTYDRNNILNQIRTNGVDPFTREKITEQDLVPNRLIKDCIDKWKKENM